MLYVVLLKFSQNKGNAPLFMAGHNEWIKNGFDHNIFLLVGSLQPGIGGAILAHNVSKADLEARVQEDPFVAEKVVEAEILEIDPKKTSPHLEFLTKAST